MFISWIHYGRSFCHPDSSVFDARVPVFSSLGRRTEGQLRRSLGLYQLMITRPIIFHLLLYIHVTAISYTTASALHSQASVHSPQILSSQHSPSANSYPFGAGSGLVLTGPTDDRWSLSTKEGRKWSITQFLICLIYCRIPHPAFLWYILGPTFSIHPSLHHQVCGVYD
jgi:hypothetical protein